MFDQADLRIASAAYNKLLKFSSERRFESQAPLSALLFHYTTADGLRGIIQDNCLHATSAYFLNDSSEIRYGYGILDRAIQEWRMRNQEAADSLSGRLLEELKERSSRDVPRIHQARPIYLACFCESDNLLSQWRAYGQSGGYLFTAH